MLSLDARGLRRLRLLLFAGLFPCLLGFLGIIGNNLRRHSPQGLGSAARGSLDSASAPWSSTEPADESFRQRCTASGVLACQGFDRPVDFVQAISPGSGLYYSGSCPAPTRKCVVRDTSVFVSGGSSARWDIYGYTADNAQGNYIQHLPYAFGPNSTFYVQFQFRVDSNWLINWETVVKSSPKIAIFYNYDGGSCAMEEITTNNNGGSGRFQMYGECGGTGFYTKTDGVTPNPEDLGDWLLQQGYTAPAPFSGYNCQSNPNSDGTFIAGSGGGLGCFKFQANTWYTLYWKVHVGMWGQKNSSVEAWIAPYGQQIKKIINAVNWTLKQNNPRDPGFDAVMLTQYMTSKNAAANHPTAHAWYDELIISTEPIAAPAGRTP